MCFTESLKSIRGKHREITGYFKRTEDKKGAVTSALTEKARGEKKKVPLAVKKRQMRQYKVEFLRNSPNYYGLFLPPFRGLDNSLNGLGPHKPLGDRFPRLAA